MENSSLSYNNTSDYDLCIPSIGSVYLYGHLIPAIALFIFGVTFNPIALYYFATSRNFHHSAYSYYFSAIAIVDLVRLIIWCLFLLLDYKIFQLHFLSYECSVQSFSESVTSSISAWLTVSLAVERCLAVSEPLQTYTDTRGKRALLVIPSVIVTSCVITSLFLQPRFYEKRVYEKETQRIICYYDKVLNQNQTQVDSKLILTPNIKRIYQLFIIIIRVAIPFMLLLTSNIILLGSIRKNEKQSARYAKTFLVRHGRHQQITPMILFSSCILLLTISPRYLLQFYVNFFHQSFNCSLIHLTPHVLKTLELFNYSLNVFVSVVGGKHARRDLFNMLLCRSTSLSSQHNGTSQHNSSVPSTMSYRRRLKQDCHEQTNTNSKELLRSTTYFL